MVSKIDLFLNRIIKEEDNNNSLKEAPSKSQAAAFIQILKILDDQNIADIILNMNKEDVSSIISVFKSVDKNDDKKLAKYEFVDEIGEFLNNTSIDLEEIAAISCICSLLTRYKDKNVFTKESSLILNPSNDLVNVINGLKNKALFYKFYNKPNKGSVGSEAKYTLKPEYSKLNDALKAFGQYRFGNDLEKNFESLESAKETLLKIKDGKDIDSIAGNFRAENEYDQLNKDLKRDIKNSEQQKKDLENEIAKTSDKDSEEEHIVSNETNPNNPFGLGVPIPDDKEIVKRETAEKFINDLKQILQDRANKILDSFRKNKSDLKSREDDEINKKKEKNNIRECFTKAGFVLKETKDTSETIGLNFETYLEKKVDGFDSYTKDFLEKTNRYILKYKKAKNYEASLDIINYLFNTYVDLAYTVASILKDLKKHQKVHSDYLNVKSRQYDEKNYKDPAKKDFDARAANAALERNYNKVKSFFTRAKNDASKIAKYILIKLISDKNITTVDGFNKIIYEKNFDNFKDIVGVGDSGKVFATDQFSVKKIQSEIGNGFDLSNMKAVPYKTPVSLITQGGLDINSLSNDVLKKIAKEYENEPIFKNALEQAEIYIKAFKELRNILLNASNKSSIATEGIKDFFMGRKAKYDDETEFSNKKSKDNNVQNYIKNNSYVISLKHPNGYDFDGEGPEDVALRQIFKGLVVLSTGNQNEWFIMNGEVYKNASKMNIQNHKNEEIQQKQEAQRQQQQQRDFDKSNNLTNQQQQIVQGMKDAPDNSVDTEANAAVVTSNAVDSTYPTTPQQRIKKICYGISPDRRYSIKSKEYFN